MAGMVRPFARALCLCDYVIGYEGGKTDLYGLFNVIRAPLFPFQQKRFCVFAQLAGGLGSVDFHITILFRPRDEVVRTTQQRQITFVRREQVIQVAIEIQNCHFTEPGAYLVELYCDDVCVADAPLELLLEEARDE